MKPRRLAAVILVAYAVIVATANGAPDFYERWQEWLHATPTPAPKAITAVPAPLPTPSPKQRKKSSGNEAPAYPAVSRADIIATVKHLIEINKELQATVEKQKSDLANAAAAQTDALNANTKSLDALTALQKQVTRLAAHDKKETDRANKLDKALWWYRLHWWGTWIVFALGVIACIVLAFLKFTGRLAIIGTAVAAKIP